MKQHLAFYEFTENETTFQQASCGKVFNKNRKLVTEKPADVTCKPCLEKMHQKHGWTCSTHNGKNIWTRDYGPDEEDVKADINALYDSISKGR